MEPKTDKNDINLKSRTVNYPLLVKIKPKIKIHIKLH